MSASSTKMCIITVVSLIKIVLPSWTACFVQKADRYPESNLQSAPPFR
jgi:hypothetical protein